VEETILRQPQVLEYWKVSDLAFQPRWIH
jgi:hypothetical protein